MRSAAVVLSGIACGALIAAAHPPTPGTSAPPIGAASPQIVERSACTMEQPLVAALILTEDDKDSATFRLETTNQLGRPIALRHAVELVDDLGTAITVPYQSADRNLPDAASEAASVVLPSGLPDGYYIARVTVVAVGPDGVSANAEAREYLRSEDGRLTAIDTIEYHDNSRADEGRPL